MKTQEVLTMVIFFTLFSCNNKATKSKEGHTLLIAKELENVPEKNKPQFSQNDFALVYEYSDGESDQLLGLNVIDKEKLQFHLVTKTNACDTEFWGVAKNEANVNDNSMFVGKGYLLEEAEYRLEMQWASDSSKVVIKYIQKDDQGTDCFPITEQIMRRIK